MTNLTLNIKKYIVGKIADLIEMVIIIFLIFYLIFKFSHLHQYAGIFILIVMIILFYITQKYTDRYFDNWIVPELNNEEKKNYNKVDTGYSVIILLILFLLFYRYVNAYLLLIILGVVFAIKETMKWIKFRKEIKVEKVEGKE